MKTLARLARFAQASAALVLWGVGCGNILGIEDGHLDPALDGCVLNSDCGGTQVCIFRVCSEPCNRDDDCPLSKRCLVTEDNGTESRACVNTAIAACSGACGKGTQCVDGQCRHGCGATSICLGDQVCQDGICFGKDATHDPGSSGAGGSAGAGGKAGSAGQSGAAGQAGSAGAAGQGGAGGLAGKGGAGQGGAGAAGAGAGGAGAGGAGQAGAGQAGAGGVCGDKVCGDGESKCTCAVDCGNPGCGECGKGKGDGACNCNETKCTTPEDCGAPGCGECGIGLGDGTCNCGETKCTAPDECGKPACGECGIGCGDKVCNCGETNASCATDCPAGCGDGQCNGNESKCDCPADCGAPGCGECGIGANDGKCNCSETKCTAPADCGAPGCGECNVGCGDGACNCGEDKDSCCQDCGSQAPYACVNNVPTLGDWWYLITTGNANQPLTSFRGTAHFKPQGAGSSDFEDSTGGTKSNEPFTWSLAGGGAFTWTQGGVSYQGQISQDGGFLLLHPTTTPALTVMVRKSTGLSPASAAGTWRMLGYLNNASGNPEYTTGYDGTMVFDGSGCLTTGSQGTTGLGPQITFSDGCLVIGPDGEATLDHRQVTSSSNGTYVFKGWLGSGGNVLVFSRPGAPFGAGTFVLVKQTGGHGPTKVNGTYHLAHLLYDATNNNPRLAYGDITFSGGFLTSGTLRFAGDPNPIGIKPESTYTIGSNGEMTVTVKDSLGNSNVNGGQAGNYTLGGLAPFLFSRATLTSPPPSASLLVWVRSY